MQQSDEISLTEHHAARIAARAHDEETFSFITFYCVSVRKPELPSVCIYDTNAHEIKVIGGKQVWRQHWDYIDPKHAQNTWITWAFVSTEQTGDVEISDRFEGPQRCSDGLFFADEAGA